jgi:hypothetical protein
VKVTTGQPRWSASTDGGLVGLDVDGGQAAHRVGGQAGVGEDGGDEVVELVGGGAAAGADTDDE